MLKKRYSARVYRMYRLWAHGKVVECNLDKNNQFVLKESNQEMLDGEYEYIDYRGKTSAVNYKYVVRMFPVVIDKFTYDKTKGGYGYDQRFGSDDREKIHNEIKGKIF